MSKEQVVGTYNLSGDYIPTDLSNEGLVESSHQNIENNVLDLSAGVADNGYVDLNRDNVVRNTTLPNTNVPDNDQNTTVENTNIDELNRQTDQNNNQIPDQIEPGDDYGDYSQAALFSKLLESNGLPIFDETDFRKDISPEDFVVSFKDKTSRYVQERTDAELEKLDSIRSYVEKVYKNNFSLDDVNPLISLQRYVDLDIDSPDITESDLENSIKSMYKLQGVAEDAIDDLVQMDKDKDLLVQKASKSKDVHKTFINQRFAQIEENKNNQLLNQKRLEAKESSDFANNLRKVDNLFGKQISDNERAVIFDNVYKRDQVVNIQGDNNKVEQVLMTKYELMMYNIVNNPENFIKLNYLLLNNLNLSNNNDVTSMNVNKKIIDALDKNKNRVINNVNNTAGNNSVPTKSGSGEVVGVYNL